MKLYKRDYSKGLTTEEEKEHKALLESEKCILGRQKTRYECSEAVRHFISLFPNNHIELRDWKDQLPMLIEQFYALIHNKETKETDILRFINNTPAYVIIASLFRYTRVGHHDAYIFPEFDLAGGKHRADYLLAGRGSGGFEFYLVELQAVNGRTVLRNGHEGKDQRAGDNQVRDWKSDLEKDFASVRAFFEKESGKELPKEFREFDSSRFHYIVITGLRDDYQDKTYEDRRRKIKEQDISMYHYDNLYDFTNDLRDANSF